MKRGVKKERIWEEHYVLYSVQYSVYSLLLNPNPVKLVYHIQEGSRQPNRGGQMRIIQFGGARMAIGPSVA